MTTATVTRSPWWDHYTVARMLHHAIANGAVVKDWTEYWAGCDMDDTPDPWFLDVIFPGMAVAVRYSTDSGFWRLRVNEYPLDRADSTVADHNLAALSMGHAAKLCRDLNFATRDRTSRGDLLTDEIEALIMDSDQHPAEIAAALQISHGVLSSKLTGSTKWSGIELLRLARVIRPHDPTEILERLLEAADR